MAVAAVLEGIVPFILYGNRVPLEKLIIERQRLSSENRYFVVLIINKQVLNAVGIIGIGNRACYRGIRAIQKIIHDSLKCRRGLSEVGRSGPRENFTYSRRGHVVWACRVTISGLIKTIEQCNMRAGGTSSEIDPAGVKSHIRGIGCNPPQCAINILQLFWIITTTLGCEGVIYGNSVKPPSG